MKINPTSSSLQSTSFDQDLPNPVEVAAAIDTMHEIDYDDAVYLSRRYDSAYADSVPPLMQIASDENRSFEVRWFATDCIEAITGSISDEAKLAHQYLAESTSLCVRLSEKFVQFLKTGKW